MHANITGLHSYMDSWMCVCIYTYIYTGKHICIHFGISAYIHKYMELCMTDTDIQIDTHPCLPTDTHTDIHECLSTYMHIYLHTSMQHTLWMSGYIHTYLYAYNILMPALIHTYKHSHTYMYAYTHTYRQTEILENILLHAWYQHTEIDVHSGLPTCI